MPEFPRTNPASDIEYFPPYKEPDIDFLKEQAKKLIAWIWKGNVNHVLRREIVPDFKCILDIVDMVERRRIYYHIFHKSADEDGTLRSMDMSECKEIALYSYWILKLQPFLMHRNGKFHARQGNEVNAIIAYRLLVNTVSAINKSFPFGTFASLLHSFRYHDISKEALIALCECLLDEDLSLP